jgi:hypothetical protein
LSSQNVAVRVDSCEFGDLPVEVEVVTGGRED